MLNVNYQTENNIIIFRNNAKIDSCTPTFKVRIFDPNETYIREVILEDLGSCINSYIKLNINTLELDLTDGMHYIDIYHIKNIDDEVIECLSWRGILNNIKKYDYISFDNVPEYTFLK